MKRLLLLLMAALLLAACGNDEPKKVEVDGPDNEKEVVEDTESKPTQDEINEKLKSEAVEYSFVEINGGEVKENEKVKLTGEVSLVMNESIPGRFMLTTTEGDGFGMYTIVNALSIDVEEGTNVTVYGSYAGVDETGMPEITSTVIESE